MADGGGGKGKLIKMIMAVLVLIGIAVGGFLGYKALLGGAPDEKAAAKGAADAGTIARGLQDFRSPTSSIEKPFYLDLGDFVVNLADKRRYLKTNIRLLLNDEKAKLYLELRLSEIKDVVLAELETLTSEQLQSPNSRARLRRSLMEKIYSIFPPDRKKWEWKEKFPVQKVLFTTFYLQ